MNPSFGTYTTAPLYDIIGRHYSFQKRCLSSSWQKYAFDLLPKTTLSPFATIFKIASLVSDGNSFFEFNIVPSKSKNKYFLFGHKVPPFDNVFNSLHLCHILTNSSFVSCSGLALGDIPSSISSIIDLSRPIALKLLWIVFRFWPKHDENKIPITWKFFQTHERYPKNSFLFLVRYYRFQGLVRRHFSELSSPFRDQPRSEEQLKENPVWTTGLFLQPFSDFFCIIR